MAYLVNPLDLHAFQPLSNGVNFESGWGFEFGSGSGNGYGEKNGSGNGYGEGFSSHHNWRDGFRDVTWGEVKCGYAPDYEPNYEYEFGDGSEDRVGLELEIMHRFRK
jgi:hypothetical protein